MHARTATKCTSGSRTAPPNRRARRCRRSGPRRPGPRARRGANGTSAARSSVRLRPAGGPWLRSPLRVLIVDDEAPARRRLRDLLDDCGSALPLTVVGEAQHGREALDLLQSAPADLVLTDIHMPDMDGIELARHLLKLSASTGGHLHDRVPRARRAGVRGQRDRLPDEAGARAAAPERAAEGAAAQAASRSSVSPSCPRRRGASCR